MPYSGSYRVIANKKRRGGAFILSFAAPEIARAAAPGQFLHIKCGHSRLLRRPISVCSVMEDTVYIVFEPRGEGTGWLAERREGDFIEVLGPLGRGFELPKGRLLAVGGGIGAAPLLYAAKRARSGASAILGFRNMDAVLLLDEFGIYCDDVHITTDDGSFGTPGSVIGSLAIALKGGGYDAVLACGPRAMLSAVAMLCAKKNIPCQVSLEERMGCGTGACLVCACKTVKNGEEQLSRVCRDGPVFNAGEVLFGV